MTTGMAAEESVKFGGAAATDGLPGRYRVTMVVQPGEDADVVAANLVAEYGGRLDVQ